MPPASMIVTSTPSPRSSPRTAYSPRPHRPRRPGGGVRGVGRLRRTARPVTAGTETLGCADRAALSDLVHRYAAGVDDRDFDSVAALFTEDGILAAAAPPKHLDPVTEHVGRDGVLEAMQALLAVRGTFPAVAGDRKSAV